jgi:threonine dehydrogenase-like Zn-dependent dehydrogenase
MRAAILEAPGRFVLTEREEPELDDYSVRVRTNVCGICTSELDMWEGETGIDFPRFAGHEVSGVVESVGSRVTSVAPGDRVALYAEGEGFAEYVAVPESWAVKLQDHVAFEHALGEPIACAVNGVRKARPELGDTVCIVGCGFMGLMMLQIFQARGVGTVIAVDTRSSILDLAKTLGAEHIINAKETDAKEAVLELTNGAGADIGVEGAGTQTTLDLTSEIVRMEGKLEVFGFHQGARRSVDWGYWNWMAFEIVNGHTRERLKYVEGMRLGLDMVAKGRLDMAPLVTHLFTLEEINAGFQTAAAKPEGFVKGVVTL